MKSFSGNPRWRILDLEVARWNSSSEHSRCHFILHSHFQFWHPVTDRRINLTQHPTHTSTPFQLAASISQLPNSQLLTSSTSQLSTFSFPTFSVPQLPNFPTCPTSQHPQHPNLPTSQLPSIFISIKQSGGRYGGGGTRDLAKTYGIP